MNLLKDLSMNELINIIIVCQSKEMKDLHPLE